MWLDEADFVPSPRIDLVFKSIFSQNVPDSRGALMDFLESVIGKEVRDVSIQENELPAANLQEKRPVLDLNCVFNDGDQANVEIQVEAADNMVPRSEYYLCKLHCSQAVQGEDYDELHYTYQISILDFSLLSSQKSYLNEYELRDAEGKPLEKSKIRLYYIELTKLRDLLEKPTEQLTRSEKWALFFKYVDDKERRAKIGEIIREEEGITMASRMLEQMAKDTAMQVTLISLEKAENDRRNALHSAEKRGMERGMQQGLQQGLQQGMQQGIEKMIRSMALKGIPSDVIAETANMSIDEIEKILQ